MKSYFLFIIFGLSFNACRPAYVTVKPTHAKIERPISPSINHVWIDGDWVYNRRSRAYIRNDGYWAKPNRGRTYTQGKWKSSRKGDYWVRGRWK